MAKKAAPKPRGNTGVGVSIERGQKPLATATIANGQTVSDEVDLRGAVAVGAEMPAAFTGTSISFQVSLDGTVFQALYDRTGTLVSVPVVASRSYDLPSELAPWRSMKIVSSGAEGGARLIRVIAKA